MQCPRCGSTDVFTSQQTTYRLKNAHHTVFWWIFIGWWWLFVKWIFLTVPALLFKIFGHKKQKLVSRSYVLSVCQACGHRWRP